MCRIGDFFLFCLYICICDNQNTFLFVWLYFCLFVPVIIHQLLRSHGQFVFYVCFWFFDSIIIFFFFGFSHFYMIFFVWLMYIFSVWRVDLGLRERGIECLLYEVWRTGMTQRSAMERFSLDSIFSKIRIQFKGSSEQ